MGAEHPGAFGAWTGGHSGNGKRAVACVLNVLNYRTTALGVPAGPIARSTSSIAAVSRVVSPYMRLRSGSGEPAKEPTLPPWGPCWPGVVDGASGRFLTEECLALVRGPRLCERAQRTTERGRAVEFDSRLHKV